MQKNAGEKVNEVAGARTRAQKSEKAGKEMFFYKQRD